MHSMSWPHILYLAFNQIDMLVNECAPMVASNRFVSTHHCWRASVVCWLILICCLFVYSSSHSLTDSLSRRHVKNDQQTYVLAVRPNAEWQTNRNPLLEGRNAGRMSAHCAHTLFASFLRIKSGVNSFVCAFALFAFVFRFELRLRHGLATRDVVQHSVRFHCSPQLHYFPSFAFDSSRCGRTEPMSCCTSHRD